MPAFYLRAQVVVAARIKQRGQRLHAELAAIRVDEAARKLKANPLAQLIDEGTHDGSAWARFTVSANLLTIRAKQRVTSPDAARHLRAAAAA